MKGLFLLVKPYTSYNVHFSVNEDRNKPVTFLWTKKRIFMAKRIELKALRCMNNGDCQQVTWKSVWSNISTSAMTHDYDIWGVHMWSLSSRAVTPKCVVILKILSVIPICIWVGDAMFFCSKLKGRSNLCCPELVEYVYGPLDLRLCSLCLKKVMHRIYLYLEKQKKGY